MKQVIYVVSTDAPMPPTFAKAEQQGKVRQVCQHTMTKEDICQASGLIMTNALDQIDMFERRFALQTMQDKGGRLVFCGHVLRPFVSGLNNFIPLSALRRADFKLERLHEHPIFADIDMQMLEENRGVAGFYGRGYNPPPLGACALTGLGSQKLPIDWVWHRPQGGGVFVHSGNDLWGCGDDEAVKQELAERLVDWCLEGQC